MCNTESGRREFLPQLRSKHQPGATGVNGGNGEAGEGSSRQCKLWTPEGSDPGSGVQEHVSGNRVSVDFNRAFQVGNGARLVVLDVDSGIFANGCRRRAVNPL